VKEAVDKHYKKLTDKQTELKDEITALQKEIASEGGNTQKQKEMEGKEEKLAEQGLKVQQGVDMKTKVEAAKKAGDLKGMVTGAHDAMANLIDRYK